MIILLADAFAADLPGKLETMGEITSDMSKLSDAEILIVRSKTKVDKAMIDKAAKLKYIIRGGVGVDTIDVEYAKSRNIKVDNTPEASSIAVAELAFALMISMPCNITEADSSMKNGKWLKKELERVELHGKTLGLIGLGRIGYELAIRAKAFGMNVVSFDKYVEKSDVARMTNLDELLSISDYISLHVPSTDETKGMINSNTISKMKKGVRIINTARGQLVVTEDIVSALKNGILGGYSADVFDKEPPENSPLLNAPKTVLTPHIGASTEENLIRLGECIVKRIKTYTGK